MKTRRLAGIVSLIVIIFLFSVFLTAFSAGSVNGAVTTYWSTTNPKPGTQVTLTVNFESDANSKLYLIGVGVHGDWMATDGFYGPNLSEDPVVVETGGLYSTKITIVISSNASLGEHSYYIGVDGYDEAGNTFSWDSSTFTVEFSDGTQTVSPTIDPTIIPTPIPTINPTQTIKPSQTPTNTPIETPVIPIETPTPTIQSPNITNDYYQLLTYVMIIAIIAVVAVFAAVMLKK